MKSEHPIRIENLPSGEADGHCMPVQREMEIRNIIRDSTFSGLLQAASIHYHRFGLNCKLSGSVYAVSEIQGAIPIIHGPEGCAFHQRLTPKSLHAPVNDLQCTQLREKEVIYGGEMNLKRTILKVYNYYRPSLIIVLPACISGLVGDDIAGVCNDLRTEIPCPVVNVFSEGFTHCCKDSLDALVIDSAKSWMSSEPPDIEFRDCGREEVILSLIDQLMNEQDVAEDLVNLEHIGRFNLGGSGYGPRRDLQETRRLFDQMGIKVNATIPSCTVEEIRQAPSAALNIVFRNRRAAKLMKKRFGTEYFFKWITHYGLLGIESFYRDVASKLGKHGEADFVIKREMKSALEDINRYNRYFKGYHFALSTRASFDTPYITKIYAEDIQLPLKYLCINTQSLRSNCASEKTIELMIEYMRKLFNDWDLDIELIVDPAIKEIIKVNGKADFHLNDRIIPPMSQNGIGCKLIDVSSISHLLLGTSFRGIADFTMYLVGFLNRRANFPCRPIAARFVYDMVNYPMIDDCRCSASRTMWSDMWALKNSASEIDDHFC